MAYFKGPAWTREEDEQLRREAAEGKSSAEIAVIHRRSRVAILSRSARVGAGLTSRGSRGRWDTRTAHKALLARKVRPGWRQDEEDALRTMAAAMKPAREIAEVLGRTKMGVYRHAQRLGIRIPGDGNYAPLKTRKAAVRPGPVVVRKRAVSAGPSLEWCSCGAPVSNWEAHTERTGHRRPAA